jgi:hypothetical protein
MVPHEQEHPVFQFSWADKCHESADAYSQKILVLGDLNLPKRDDSNNVYKGLKAICMLIALGSKGSSSAPAYGLCPVTA